MPKPLSDRTGSGMHMHLSLADAKNPNLFLDRSDRRKLGLSAAGYQFLGGLLAHAPALTALVAPTVNSYKRLVVGRVVFRRDLGARLSSPMATTTALDGPHTLRQIGVATDRFKRQSVPRHGRGHRGGTRWHDKKLDPGEPHNFNHYDLSEAELVARGIKTLPQSLPEALDALEADGLFHEALGKKFVAEFIRLKRMEWVDYHRHVSDWEVKRYLEFY